MPSILCQRQASQVCPLTAQQRSQLLRCGGPPCRLLLLSVSLGCNRAAQVRGRPLAAVHALPHRGALISHLHVQASLSL